MVTEISVPGRRPVAHEIERQPQRILHFCNCEPMDEPSPQDLGKLTVIAECMSLRGVGKDVGVVFIAEVGISTELVMNPLEHICFQVRWREN
jgi:hypothetical protein